MPPSATRAAQASWQPAPLPGSWQPAGASAVPIVGGQPVPDALNPRAIAYSRQMLARTGAPPALLHASDPTAAWRSWSAQLASGPRGLVTRTALPLAARPTVTPTPVPSFAGRGVPFAAPGPTVTPGGGRVPPPALQVHPAVRAALVNHFAGLIRAGVLA